MIIVGDPVNYPGNFVLDIGFGGQSGPVVDIGMDSTIFLRSLIIFNAMPASSHAYHESIYSQAAMQAVASLGNYSSLLWAFAPARALNRSISVLSGASASGSIQLDNVTIVLPPVELQVRMEVQMCQSGGGYTGQFGGFVNVSGWELPVMEGVTCQG